MSTRKPSPRNRALRPLAEDLEGRQLLSATVSGIDAKGDQWTLQLIGPGSLVVTKQNDSSGSPGSLNSATDINTITIGGTDPKTTRLIDHVTPAAGSDGRVFFQNLIELSNKSERGSQGNGPLAINIPDFWLANTTPAANAATATAPAITIPDGTSTLRFGGVDTRIGQVTPVPTTTTSQQDTISLGLPQFGGTRIIIDKSISSAQTVPPSGTSTTPTTVQDSVVFAVAGRLDLFQANEIDGNTAFPPGHFSGINSAATGFGGTWVVSGTPGTSGLQAPFFTNAQQTGGATGQIGDVRIGGNATNFSTFVFDGTGSGNAKISNYSVGGETTNVLVVAPNGGQNFSFGEGMDTVLINAHVLHSLHANRGALNSQVFVDRTISQVLLGGDVVNTNVVTGVQQNYLTIFNNVTGQSSSPFLAGTVTPPPQPLNAQNGGGMTVTVAGSVTNSVFAASVQPGTTTSSTGTTTPQFGTPQDLVLPTGHIRGKIEGTINNTSATPDQPGRAFYASKVTLDKGPVVPPNVPQAPYTGHQQYVSLPGISHVQRAGKFRA